MAPGWMMAFPAPSLRELLSECEAEGVYPDERNHSKNSECICAGVQIFGPEEPSNDTPSVSPSGCQLPQRGSREMFPFNRVLAKIRGYGRFSSPLRNSECLTAPIHRSTLPQSRIRSTAPSGREPGQHPPQCQSPVRWMFCQRAGDFWLCVGGCFAIQPGACETVGVAGDFHRPYETQNVLHSTIHPGTRETVSV